MSEVSAVLKRSKYRENIGEFRLFTAKNMSRFVEISSRIRMHFIEFKIFIQEFALISFRGNFYERKLPIIRY